MKGDEPTLELAAAPPREGSVDRRATIEAWVSDYGTGVLRLAYSYMKDRHLAEDVLQEVFTKAFLNLDRFRGQSHPRSWLYRITVNLCHDRLGAWNARKVLLVGEEMLAATLGSRDYTEEQAFEKVDAEILLAAILKMPVEYREILMLVYYADLDLKEAGEALGLPGGTARSRMHRARHKLRELLEEEGWLES